LFANAACDPSGNGEGQHYERTLELTTDGSGSAPIHWVIAPALPASQKLTLTATDQGSLDSSGFSNCK
jgi:hypothetical protein